MPDCCLDLFTPLTRIRRIKSTRTINTTDVDVLLVEPFPCRSQFFIELAPPKQIELTCYRAQFDSVIA